MKGQTRRTEYIPSPAFYELREQLARQQLRMEYIPSPAYYEWRERHARQRLWMEKAKLVGTTIVGTIGILNGLGLLIP